MTWNRAEYDPSTGRYYPTGRHGGMWWLGGWTRAIAALDTMGRLARGWNAARRITVSKLHVAPGLVTADAQTYYADYHRVRIRVATLPDEVWDFVTAAIAAEAIHGVRVASGQMSPEFEMFFTNAGASPFPRTADEVEAECDCPDPVTPCKHITAVHYRLSEGIDADPYLLFTLRGRTRDDLAAAVRRLRTRVAGGAEVEDADSAGDAGDAPPAALALVPDPEVFWTAGRSLDDMTFTLAPPSTNARPIKQLDAPAFLYDRREFTRLMDDGYRAITAHAVQHVLDKQDERR